VDGHFTNGNVWVQDLSQSLGLGPLTASLIGGNDYAYGSASSGTTPVNVASQVDLTGPTGQVSQFLAAHPNPSSNASALYTIWIGSNDVSEILASHPSNQAAATDIAAVVANIDSAINTLASAGAKDFLILTVPDVGKTPDAISAGPATQAALSTLSGDLDEALVYGVPSLLPSLGQVGAADGIDISVLDTYSLIDELVADPAAGGFTDVTDPCVTGSVNYVGGTACANPDQYLFWDGEHPTAAGHALVADAALSIVTPEPATVALLGLGLLAVCVRRRRSL
jgi:phospholipase/lecithinase/hemolysin